VFGSSPKTETTTKSLYKRQESRYAMLAGLAVQTGDMVDRLGRGHG
jgi:hypothetical protein